MKARELNGVTMEDAINQAGYVLGWIEQSKDVLDMGEVIENIMDNYGYPSSEMKGGTLYPDGTYDYPQDPEMVPNMVIHIVAGRIYSYDYGMFSFFDNYGGTKMYRLD